VIRPTLPTTRLLGIELREVDLGLTSAVGTAVGTHRGRPLLLARAITEHGEGWGECGALETAVGTDLTIEELLPFLRTAARELVARGDASPEAVRSITGDHPAARMARALFEMALLDDALCSEGRSLAVHLGAQRDAVAVGAVVGIPTERDRGAVLAAVDAALDGERGGAVRVRLKIAPDWDVEPVAAVRARYPDLALQVDANGAYPASEDGTERLQRLDAFGLTCIEQPLPVTDLEGHARLRQTLATAVALDESLWSLARVAGALEAGAMDVACLKPARLGGLAAALGALRLCTEAGCRAFVGGMFESGLGRSANAALSAVPGFDLPGDLTSPVGYLSAQPFSYPPVRAGMVLVPTGCGIGATADRDVIERHSVSAEWFGGAAT
jgi:O-succinylbenzoate synthase